MFQLRATGRTRFTSLLAVSAALALTATACSSGGGDQTSLGGGSDDDGDSGDLTSFNVAMVSSLDTEPYYYALENGYYEDAGLDVDFSTSDSGPSLVTGVLNGTYDAASSAAFPVLIAIGKDTDLKIFPGASVVGPDSGNSGLVVKPDSGISGFADLEGKTVATNALTSLTTLALKAGVKDAGIDPDSVDVTALPFKASVQAVSQDQADAAVVISPFQTEAEMNGMEVIGDPIGTEMPEGSPYNILFSSAETSEEKTDEFAAFNEATLQAVEELREDPDLQRELAVDLVGLDEDLAAEVTLPTYNTTGIDVDAFQQYADMVAEFGYTDEPVDVSNVVVNP